jgi:integrase
MWKPIWRHCAVPEQAVKLIADRIESWRANERKEISRMARRRFQKGCLFKKGKNWVLRYREDVLNSEGNVTRTHRCVVLGDFDSKKAARRAADSYLLQFNDGTRCLRAAITFEDFCNNYFTKEVLPNRKFATDQVYRRLAKVHLLPFFGAQKLSDITRFDVQRLVSLKQRQGYAPKTLAHLRSLLSKVFSVAIKWNWLNANPATGIELPPMQKRRETRLLNPVEITTLSQNLTDPARTIFVLAVLAGLRIGEILALRPEDIDLARGFVSVRRNVYRGHVQDSPKTQTSERRVPLAAFALASLQQWLSVRPPTSEWLFPSAAARPFYDRNLLRREVWPVCERHHIPKFGWHALRHTFSTYNGNSGVPMPVLQSLLGHASPETTMIYTHPLEEAQRCAVEKLAGILFPNVPSDRNYQEGGPSLTR